MMVDKKRAQFYLMAAIIIVVVLIGVATVTNVGISRQSADEIKLYQLSQELSLEGEQVINFGIVDDGGVDNAVKKFVDQYGSYVNDQEKDIYFVYGNKKKINVVGYITQDSGSVGLDFGAGLSIIQISGSSVSFTDRELFDGLEGSPDFSDISELFGCNSISECDGIIDFDKKEIIKKDVIVTVGGTKYPFEIKQGQNFFFIIQQDRTGDGGGEIEPECTSGTVLQDCGGTICPAGEVLRPSCEAGRCIYTSTGETC